MFGRIEIEDPRPTARAAPYTFYLPPQDRLDLLQPGDLAKLIIASVPHSRVYDAERMWVKIETVDGDNLAGSLDNHPFDIPQLKLGARIEFKSWQIIDYEFADKDRDAHLPPEISRQHWDGCMVDPEILNGPARVGYLYREDPDMGKDGDEYADSGWRIREDVLQLTDEQYDNPSLQYVALGAVLNQDDSWIHLIDAPIGKRFLHNNETGEFEETE